MQAAARTWRPQDDRAYSYLLGIYLGDGCVSVRRRGGTDLRITLDARYNAIVDECCAAIAAVMPDCRVSVRDVPGEGSRVIGACTDRWVDAFPQHGPGPKHTRPIVLAAWQRRIVESEPEAMLRGLIHSDGCRTVNRFTTRLPSGRTATYAYPRYFFSNLSADIRELFCERCDQLGIRWTQSNPRNISVAHRDSVARLDAFVGAKR